MPTTKDIPSYLSDHANTGPALSPAANRLQGANQHDFTSHMPSQVSWTIDSMPDILYQWKPTAANINTDEVDLKPYLIFGKVLRDFDVLPDRISSNVEPWLLQAWFRLDSRIRWEDITDRIEPSARPKWNTINMDCVRQREDFFMRPWSPSKGVSTRTRDRVFEKVLRKAGIDPARNTTRGLTPGLIDPSAGPNSARIPVPKRWTKSRKQRKAEVETVVAVKGERTNSGSRISPRNIGGRMWRAIRRKENGNHKPGERKRGTPTNVKLDVDDQTSLGEQKARDSQAPSVNKVEGVSGRQPRKRKATTIETEEVDEDRTPKRRDMGVAKQQRPPVETPRKRKSPRSGETEQKEQERPRKLRKLRPKAVEELELELRKEAEDYDDSLYPDLRSAQGRKRYGFQSQTLLPVSPQSRKQLMAASSRVLTLSKEKQATDIVDVGARRAYIGYLQAPVVEPNYVQMESMRREPPAGFASNTSGYPPLVHSPALGTVDFRVYADTETEHSADLSLPSAVMTPRDLGEDMISSNHSTQCDLFGDCMVDDFEDIFQRTFYNISA